MAQLVVNIGDIKYSSSPNDTLKTYALGSCVAVMIYNRSTMHACMAHIALPDSNVNIEKSKELPGYFVDTCIPYLLNIMQNNQSNGKNLVIKLAGGANVADPNSFFDIGKRNILAIRKLFWKHRLPIVSEDTGGSISRTVDFAIDTGNITISSGGKKWNL